MNHAFTPEPDAGVLTRLEVYAAHFAADFIAYRAAGLFG